MWLIHNELLQETEDKGVKKLIETLGGAWGKIGLERQYEEAEAAIFMTSQRQDESNDSYLTRSDISWSKLKARQLSLEDLEAFILLRGSTLTPDDKKRVILESDSSASGKLTVQKVRDSIRVLGASFFQEMTGIRKPTKSKVYDSTTLVTEDGDPEASSSALTVNDEAQLEEEFMEEMYHEGDEDAALVADF